MSDSNERVKPFDKGAAEVGKTASMEAPHPGVLASQGDNRFDDYVRNNRFREAPVTETPTKPTRRQGGAPFKVLLGAIAVLTVTLLGLSGYFTLMDYYGRGWIPGLIATIPMLAVVFCLLWLCGREIRGYASLRSVDSLRHSAERLRDDAGEPLDGKRKDRDALTLVHRVAHLYRNDGGVQRRFKAFLEGYSDTHTQPEILALFSRDVLRPLDEEAYRRITRYGIQSATLSAISSFVALDMLLTLWRNMRMLHDVATVYGVRPGFVRSVSLARHALEALAVSGASEVVSDMVAENLGNHLVGALSARLGDGLSNGLMTARLGLIIAAECRPLPFTEEDRHGFRKLRVNILKALKAKTSVSQPHVAEESPD
ncbi:TIGR01620 family protein [Mangrovitalea sediminis]|uniref:TIGR01620 family protein n=1 Tax=Mangrovitalea sediminis TaxID=1982043 RepID=UPI000BE5B2F1|nr:TIGR01620 family protein [Mangrovitalea sediminis]